MVKPDVAAAQRQKDLAKQEISSASMAGDTTGSGADTPSTITTVGDAGEVKETEPAPPRRFYGSVALDSTRLGRDAGRIAEEVIAHLVAIEGARVRITLEIEANVAKGVDQAIVRAVTENCRTLNFSTHGFERE